MKYKKAYLFAFNTIYGTDLDITASLFMLSKKKNKTTTDTPKQQ